MESLEKIYNTIYSKIKKVDFDKIWKGFYPIKFAVYNENECFFNGEYIHKGNSFIANTAIEFNGEEIAIWRITDESNLDYDILTSKLIHEMFHGYQKINHEARFPDEMKALINYKYDALFLTIKYMENNLMVQLINKFNEKDFNKLLSLRKLRHERFPFEFMYEMQTEQIEGSARFVELMALKQISLEKYNKEIEQTEKFIIDINRFLPARIMCYETGALYLFLLKQYGNADIYSFSNKTIGEITTENILAFNEPIVHNEHLQAEISFYYDEMRKVITEYNNENNCILSGKYSLKYVNIYNAKYLNDFIYSTYFVMYEDKGKDAILNGDFLVHLCGDMILDKIYKIR